MHPRPPKRLVLASPTPTPSGLAVDSGRVRLGPASLAPITLLARLALAVCMLASFVAPGHAAAETYSLPTEEWQGEDGLNGRAIYDRVTDNRFDASEQMISMSSKDRSDHRQYVELEMKYLRPPQQEGEDTIAMSIAHYTRPLDIRGMGYLVINKRNGPDDQFVYRPSARNVRRIHSRTETISGTDFTLEDLVPQEVEDADHYRMPDSEHGGKPVWVVTVVPHESANSSYSKFVVLIEKERAVPLQTDYWDDRGVHIKQLRADPKSLEAFKGYQDGEPKRVWIVRRSKMMHLKRESQTVLNVLDFRPDPELAVRDFSQRQLTQGR